MSTTVDKPPLEDSEATSAFRMRLGIGLWLLSWVPFATALVQFMVHEGWISEGQQSHRVLMLLWAIQIAIGFLGIFIAGSGAIELVKSYGLKRVPREAWRIIIGKGPSPK